MRSEICHPGARERGAKTTTPNANLNLLPDASIELQQVVKRERSISAG